MSQTAVVERTTRSKARAAAGTSTAATSNLRMIPYTELKHHDGVQASAWTAISAWCITFRAFCHSILVAPSSASLLHTSIVYTCCVCVIEWL